MKTRTRIALVVLLVVAGWFLSQTVYTAVQTGVFATSTVEAQPDASVPISDLSAAERAVMDELIDRDRVPTATVSVHVMRSNLLTVSRIGSTIFFGLPESRLPDATYVRAGGETYRRTFVGSVFGTRLPRTLVSGICFLAALVLWRRDDAEVSESTVE